MENVLQSPVVKKKVNLLRLFDERDDNYRKKIYVKVSDELKNILSRKTNGQYLTLDVIYNFVKKWSRDKTKEQLQEKIVQILSVINYFKTFNGKEIKLPNELSKDLLYFVGVIVGDGSLPIKHNGQKQRNYVVSIEKANRKFISSLLQPLVKEIFDINWSLITRKVEKKKKTWILYLYSKPLYRYLTQIFELPEGKKCYKIRMPSIIRNLKPHERIPFIAGVMDTDWGILGGDRFGVHCASKLLLEDTKNTLEELTKIKLNVRKFKQKNKYTSYQVMIPKRHKQKLFNVLQTYFPLKNHKRIRIFSAGMAESG